MDFKAWATNWLTKAGVNEILAVVEKDLPNNKYRISLRQWKAKHGDPIFHEQVLDLALYDDDMNFEFVRDVHVQGEELTSNVYEGSLDKLPKAIFVNANNKGYCRV